MNRPHKELCPCAFLDRDGTINVDGGYINHPNNFILYPYAAQAIRMLNMAGWLVVVVTNQSGVGRGFYSEEMMHTLNAKMISLLDEQGAKVDGVYYCPHDVNSIDERYRVDCDCRKPAPGMLTQAMKELPIDPERMYIVGDKYSDMQAGDAVGCSTILVKTGYGEGDLESKSHSWEKMPDHVVKNLLEATKVILDSK